MYLVSPQYVLRKALERAQAEREALEPTTRDGEKAVLTKEIKTIEYMLEKGFR